MASVCLRGECDAEQIEGAALGLGGGGKDGGEAIAPKADDIAGEGGEIAKQGMEAVHWEWFAICRVSAFANGLALRGRRGLGPGHRRDARRLAGGWIGLVEQHRGEAPAHVPLQIIGQHTEQDVRARTRGAVQWNTGRSSRSTVFSERKACSTPLRLL
jgi:hypothetical protein